MKAIIQTKKEVDIKFLYVEAGVRYWEDATVNGKEDESGDLIPFRQFGIWKPIIDIDLGKIIDWPKGVEADIHYKVCDSGSYYLKDEEGNTILSIEDDYVPEIMCPEGNGYGDYIIMKVDANGQIANWEKKIKDFKEAE